MLESIDWATAIMDDIILPGKTVEAHDTIIKMVLQRAMKCNVKLNTNKCKLRHQKFVEHTIADEVAKHDPGKNIIESEDLFSVQTTIEKIQAISNNTNLLWREGANSIAVWCQQLWRGSSTVPGGGSYSLHFKSH